MQKITEYILTAMFSQQLYHYVDFQHLPCIAQAEYGYIEKHSIADIIIQYWDVWSQ